MNNFVLVFATVSAILCCFTPPSSPQLKPVEASVMVTPPTPQQVEQVRETRRYFNVPLDRDLQDYIYSQGRATGIQPELIVAIIKTESNCTNTISECGDYGLMQINRVNHPRIAKKFGEFDPMDKYQNIRAGVSLLAECRDYWEKRGMEGKELEVAMLSSYNRGIGGYEQYGTAVSYVSKIERNRGII